MVSERDTGLEVRDQYEAYPYPPRDPADEAKRLVTGSPSHLDELNHYVFGGRREFRQPFRALVAGCGTGDGAIMLAQQLADRGGPAEIICLDLSTASLGIATARAKARSLGNIRFHHASLFELERLDLGRFDYIDCCGVLHHLDDPPAGLEALRRALKPGGGMGLMVYAPLGRAGVYEIQSLLRLISGDEALEARIALARQALEALPENHPFRSNTILGDHRQLGTAGLVDLLLHARDRAYFVPELIALVEQAGLAISALIEPVRYRPEHYVADPDLKQRLAALDAAKAWAAAELIGANLKRHIAYVVEPEALLQAVARPNASAIPVLKDVSPKALGRTLGAAGGLVLNYDGVRMRFPLPPEARAIAEVIDGARTLGEIHRELGPLFPHYDDFKAAFDALYAALNGANIMVLRYDPSRR
ncbi:MAG: class I SAM-dependent methyltransferase [Alphaproteobacteria bacterium]|nr:class I SAM-dependent methyltransferase [Alphaproteobacteria bacterium]